MFLFSSPEISDMYTTKITWSSMIYVNPFSSATCIFNCCYVRSSPKMPESCVHWRFHQPRGWVVSGVTNSSEKLQWYILFTSLTRVTQAVFSLQLDPATAITRGNHNYSEHGNFRAATLGEGHCLFNKIDYFWNNQKLVGKSNSLLPA